MTVHRSDLKMPKPVRRIFVILVLLGFGLRLGYGMVRYGSDIVRRSGTTFINSWNHDALYHVLIAKALLTGEGYIVDASPVPGATHVRYAGQDAIFKAPGYQFFLAAIFAVSGYSFKLFFPLQALFGGITAGGVGLIAWQLFRRINVVWFAGLAAAIQPVLVNSASQPYNESLFYLLFVVSAWAGLMWLATQRIGWGLLCAIATGLCILTRENGSLLLFSLGAVVLIRRRWTAKDVLGYILIAAVTIAVVAPWTIRNYLHFGIFVPVASILGTDFTEGNNQCIASEGVFQPYYAEGSCPSLDEKRRAWLASHTFDPRVPMAVRVDLASRRIGMQFVGTRPSAYAKLAFRRLWTTLLPFDPRGPQHRQERIVLSLYWLVLFPAGLTGMFLSMREIHEGRLFLALLVILNLMSIVAVLYWSDLRFRVSIELPLACFAGWTYDRFLLRKITPQSEGETDLDSTSIHHEAVLETE